MWKVSKYGVFLVPIWTLFTQWTFLMHNNCWKKISTYLRLMFPFFTPSGFLTFSGSIKRGILAWYRLVFYIIVMRGIRIRNGTINIFLCFFSELISQFRPARRGGRQGYLNNKPRGGGNSRLRSIDSEQHLFSPTNRLMRMLIVINCNCAG